MPSRPEKSIALYQSDQADQYDQAVRVLEECGEIDSEASEGEKVATLSQVVLEQAQQEEPSSKGRSLRIPWGTLSLVLGVAGTLAVLAVLLGTAVFVASHVFI